MTKNVRFNEQYSVIWTQICVFMMYALISKYRCNIFPIKNVRRRSIEITCTEYISTSIAPSSELSVVAVSAIDFFHFRSKLFVYQRHATFAAQETGLVPVFVFVRQILNNEIMNNITDNFAVYTYTGHHCGQRDWRKMMKQLRLYTTQRTFESMPMVLSHSSHGLANTDS